MADWDYGKCHIAISETGKSCWVSESDKRSTLQKVETSKIGLTIDIKFFVIDYAWELNTRTWMNAFYLIS